MTTLNSVLGVWLSRRLSVATIARAGRVCLDGSFSSRRVAAFLIPKGETAVGRIIRRRLLTISVAVFSGLFPTMTAVAGAAPLPQIQMIDLGTLGGPSGYSAASAVNDRGEVIGVSTVGVDDGAVFLWRDGQMIDLGVRGNPVDIRASDINSHGQVVGCAASVGGFRWDNGVLTDLGEMACAVAVNGPGQIVGISRPFERPPRMVRWDNGVLVEGPEQAVFAQPVDINDRGEIVGTTGLYGPGGPIVGFRWSGDTFTVLGSVEWGSSLTPAGINNSGQICGSVGVDDGTRLHAVIWHNGVITDITPAASFAYATAINAAGDVVGVADDQPFLWHNGTLTYLSRPGFTGFAYAINDAGDVTGVHLTADTTTPFLWRAGRLIPLPGNRDPVAMNSHGVLAGNTVVSGELHAAVWLTT